MEYFHFIVMNSMKNKWKLKDKYKKKKKKKKEEEGKRKKKNKKNKVENHLIQMKLLSGWLIRKKHPWTMKYLKKHFKVQKPSVMHKVLYETNDKEKNKLVDIFNSRLKDLKEEIKNMSKEEREIENPELIVKIVEMILKFN